MRDDDELAGGSELPQETYEPAHVRLVQRGVYLVEKAERGGLDQIGREQERDRGQGFFAPRKKADRFEFLARRLGENFDARLENMFRIHQPEFAPPSAEEPAEHGVEVLPDLVIRGQEAFGAFLPYLVGDAAQVPPGFLEVRELGREEFEPFPNFGEFFGGHEIHGSEILEPLPERCQPLAQVGDGHADLEHALLEFDEVAGVLLGEIFTHVPDLGVQLGPSEMQPLELRMPLAELHVHPFEVVPPARDLAVPGGDVPLESFQFRGEQSPSGLDVRDLLVQRPEFLQRKGESSLLAVDFGLDLPEEGFLPGEFAPEHPQVLVGRGSAGLHSYPVAPQFLERCPVRAQIFAQPSVLGPPCGDGCACFLY